jgi:DNA-binding NarL/FixJ family response regulator
MGELSNKRSPYSLSDEDRSRARVVIASANAQQRNQIKESLEKLGYTSPLCVSKFSGVISRLDERDFTHLICTVDSNDIPPKSFIVQAKQRCADMQCIVMSVEPDVDEMFELLIAGAKAYTAVPASAGELDQTMAFATKGPEIPASVLAKQNRTQAIIAAVLVHLDKLADAKAQCRVDSKLLDYLPFLYASLGSSVETAMKLVRGNLDAYLHLIEMALIKRGSDKATRLGRLRQRLSTERV